MRVLELFSGYGSQALALENLGIEFVSYISEIDPYAIKAYNQIHGDTHNWGDITKIDETKLPYYDLITYSSPCQDFSVAGLGRGGDEGSGTRSSLLWECERIIRAVKPKYLLMENVKNLVGEKHKHNFIRWLRVLEMMGYWNFWQVLNAKDYGVPQNRERVFVVSIRKDVDTKGYKFPSPIPLKKRLKDMLEPVVDEKYYLSADKVEKFANALNKKIENQDVSYCIDANYWKGTTPQQFLNKNRRQLVKDVSNTIRCGGGSLDGKHTWDVVVEPFIADDTQGFDGVRYYDNYSPTLRSERSGLKVVEPLQIKEATQKGYAEAYEYDSVSLDHPNSKTRRGRVGKQISNTLTCSCNMGVVEPKIIQVRNIVNTGNWDNPQRGRIYSPSGISPALNTVGGGGLEPKIFEEGVGLNPLSRKLEFNGFKENSPSLRATDYKCPHCYSDGYRIRKLTARECWRLMGVKDEQYDKLHDISNSQLYKMAGNSIVVDVLMAIFKNMFLSDEGTKGQLTLF